MDSLSIEAILTQSSSHFSGCFPSDRIPYPTSFPSIIVANLDPHYKSGSHWVVLFAQSPEQAYFFCPFGREPTGRIREYLNLFPKVRRNRCVFQPRTSIACGCFAVFVVYHLSKGNSFDDVLRMLCGMDDADSTVQVFTRDLTYKYSS